MKISAAIMRAVKDFPQLVRYLTTQAEDLSRRSGEVMTGRQRLSMIAKYCSCHERGSTWSVMEFLSKLQLTDKNVETFMETWSTAIGEAPIMEEQEHTYAAILYKKMRNLPMFAFEVAAYDRAKGRAKERSYAHLMDAIDLAAHRRRQEVHQQERLKGTQAGGGQQRFSYAHAALDS